jgi:hypothetical protein
MLCPALASAKFALAGGVYEAGLVTVRWTWSPMVDEVVSDDRLSNG